MGEPREPDACCKSRRHVVTAVEVFSIYSVSFNPLNGFIKCRYKYCYKLINLIVVARLST